MLGLGGEARPLRVLCDSSGEGINNSLEVLAGSELGLRGSEDTPGRIPAGHMQRRRQGGAAGSEVSTTGQGRVRRGHESQKPGAEPGPLRP